MAGQTQWSLEGQFACGSGFLVTPDCLGETFVSKTASYDVSILLPQVDDASGGSDLTRPLRRIVSPAVADDSESDGRTEWGSIAGGTRESPVYAHILHCGFRAQVSAADADEFAAVAKTVAKELAAWWNKLCDWLDLVSLQEFAKLGAAQRSILHDAVHMWSGDDEGVRKAGVTYQVFPGGIHQVEVLDRDQTQAAMDFAATGRSPETEWLFIRDAKMYLRAGDHRRAVIDACTATELALTALIDKQFDADKLAPPERKKKFKAHHGISNLVLLHKKTKVPARLPKKLVEEVGAPRNRAAHQGATLSGATARAAIRAAAQVVEAAFPLQSSQAGSATKTLTRKPRLGMLPQHQNLHLMSGNSMIIEAPFHQ